MSLRRLAGNGCIAEGWPCLYDRVVGEGIEL